MSRAAAAAPAAIALAIVLRLAAFPFAENKHGDAPMRALIAERMVLEPASAGVPRTYCQFGPLHTTLMRPFIALDRVASRSSRYLSLFAGIGVLFPFLAFARRVLGQSGEAGAALATFALAVSPLHIQASTTAASEALYLLLWVCALERLLAALAGRAGHAVAHLRRRRPARIAGGHHALRHVAGAARRRPRGCDLRARGPARAAPRARCLLAVRGVAPGGLAGVGRARRRAIRSSSRTTS